MAISTKIILLCGYACSLAALFLLLMRRKRRRRKQRLLRLRRHIKIRNFYEHTLQHMSSRNFRRYIRMNRNTFHTLCEFVSGITRMENYIRTSRIKLEKIVAMTCVYLGSKMTTLAISDLFGVNEETFLRCTQKVLESIVDCISQLIYWPDRSQYEQIRMNFNGIGKNFFPNVIGAMDGCHLEIELTEEKVDDVSYQNYHQYNSIILLGIATYDLSFIQVHAGWPGRANDSRFWTNTDTFEKLDNYLADGSRSLIDSYHIVADSAFPCRKHLMTPYKSPFGEDLDVVRSNFNRCLSSKRQNIERAFSLLKHRFPRIEKLNQKSSEKKLLIVMACCGIHNILIRENDNVNYFLSNAQNSTLIHWPNLPTFTEAANRQIGSFKRDLLARALFTN